MVGAFKWVREWRNALFFEWHYFWVRMCGCGAEGCLWYKGKTILGVPSFRDLIAESRVFERSENALQIEVFTNVKMDPVI